MIFKFPKNFSRLLRFALLAICVLIPAFVIVMKVRNYESLLAINLMIACVSILGLYCLYRALRLFRRTYPYPLAPEKLTQYRWPLDSDAVRDRLRTEGYSFHRQGEYAEFGNLRRLSTAVLFSSLSLLFMVGVYDNLRTLNGMLFIHTEAPKPLYELGSYQLYGKGPLASFSEIPYKLRGVEMFEGDSRYPLGAMKMRLLSEDETESWQFLLTCLGEGYRKDGLTFYLNSLEYDVALTVLIDGDHMIYSDWLHLVPLRTPVGSYTHSGELKKNSIDDVGGSALFDPVTNSLKVKLRHTQKYIDVVLFNAPPEHEMRVENYLVRLDGVARRGHVKVTRNRHVKTLAALAGMVILSAVVALCTPRRRVWITSGDDGSACIVKGDDANLLACFVEKGATDK